MISFLSTNIIYDYNDMVLVLVRGLELYSGVAFFPLYKLGSFFSQIDFIHGITMQLLFANFNPIFVANFYAIFYLLVSVALAYMVFIKFVEEKPIAAVFALFYGLSIYYIYRVISFTPSVYQTFFYPLIFYLIWFKGVKPVLLGVVLFVLFGISSYLAFFAFLNVLFWYLAEAFFTPGGLISKVKSAVTNIFKVSVPLFLLTLVFYLPLLIKTLPVFERLRDPTSIATESYVRYDYRPIEDWYNLSLRPWYFVIPPKESLFFGELSKSIHQKIVDTGYYLANDYEEQEMAGSYMGWHFVLGVLVAPFFLKKSKNWEFLKKIYVVLLLAFIFSLPPSFTISGITIYTPSYLLYFVFPVFRTLVRWSASMYFFVLLINLVLFKKIYDLFKFRVWKVIALVYLALGTYVILGIGIPVIDLNRPPAEIAFLRGGVPKDSTIAIYPTADYYSLFWLLHHNKKIINPVGFTGADEISRNMVTGDGIRFLKSNSVRVLVVYKSRLSDKVLEEAGGLNPAITSREDLDRHFGGAFGQVVYEDQSVSIYQSAGE